MRIALGIARISGIAVAVAAIAVLASTASSAQADAVLAHDQTLLRHSASLNNYFGQSVAMSEDGSVAVIGAAGDAQDTQFYEGSASVFVRAADGWTEVQTLKQTGGRPQDRFGTSVAISASGDRIVVGAGTGDSSPNSSRGAMTIFNRSGSQWIEEAKITPAGATEGDQFARDVDISSDGTVIVAGAPGDGTQAKPGQGSIYVYRLVNSEWLEESNLWLSDGDSDDRFGRAVTISGDGDTLMAGSPLRDRGSEYDQGRVTIFENNGGWVNQISLMQPGGNREDYLGDALDLDQNGTHAAAGAVGAAVGGQIVGTTMVLSKNNGTWSVDTVLSHSNPRSYGAFGTSVSLSTDGAELLVGAPHEVGGGVTYELGDSTMFRLSETGWSEQEHLTVPYGRTGSQGFGAAVSLAGDGQSAFVGAYAAPVNGTQTAGTVMTFIPSYPLTVTKSGTGYGWIKSAPARINCSTGCQRYFGKDSTVTLTAEADDGSAFDSWTGACAGSSTTCEVTMTEAKSVTGTFRKTHFSIGIVPQGEGAGSVKSTPAGIDCGDACYELFPIEQAVTLTAEPAVGSILIGWNSSFSGICEGVSLTCQVSSSGGPRDFSPQFEPAQTLTASTSGSGSGTITSSPEGVQCGNACVKDFRQGIAVVLTASAAPGSVFDGWTGACSGATAFCNVTMNQARNVEATFTALHQLSLTKAGTGSGRITDVSGSIDCGASCSASYRHGETVGLFASPSAGSKFSSWSGSCSGQVGVCSIDMTAAESAIAIFDTVDYSLTLTKSGTGTGTISSSPSGISCGASCSGAFRKDTMVTLQASPGKYSLFASWSGACAGNQPTCVVPITSAKEVDAQFVATDYELTVNRQGSGSVDSAPTGISCGVDCNEVYPDGSIVTLQASPESGATFEGWTGPCQGTTPTCQVAVNSTISVGALFTSLDDEPTPPAKPTPKVSITKKPAPRTRSPIAMFKFASTVSGSAFQCSLDKQNFRSCATKTTFRNLKPGTHIVRVRATADGMTSNVKSFRWRIQSRKRH